MKVYKTPGVFIEEIPVFPQSIASVETAIPAFIGYTQKAQYKRPGDLKNKPKRIISMLEYEKFFGYPKPETGISVTIDARGASHIIKGKINNRSKYLMYYSLQMFFINGGGACYIVSVGNYSRGSIYQMDLKIGLDKIAKVNEVTLILFPDGLNMSSAKIYYALHKKAMEQCKKLKDRFVVMDVYINPKLQVNKNTDVARDLISGTTDILKYAAIYYPRIKTQLDYSYKKIGSNDDDDTLVKIKGIGNTSLNGTLAELKNKNNAFYTMAKDEIKNIEMLLPASSAIAGKYAEVDNDRGVWKAPANVNINYAAGPEILITNKELESLNVDEKSGKSINAIRSFTGRGSAIIWGARTLAGNDNEWRYIPVRRYFNMIEESIKNATEQFVFEPNDSNTWIRVKSMVENYLTQQWKSGALMGATTWEAFFVKVGLGETMSEIDILEGRMIVEIGMAMVRPAEFVILRFMHKMLSDT